MTLRDRRNRGIDWPVPDSEGPIVRLPHETWRLSVLALLCVLAGSSIGLLLIPRAPNPQKVRASPEKLSLLGTTLPADKRATDEAKERARDYLARTFTLVVPGSPAVAHTLSKWGVQTDEHRLATNVADALDPSSPLRRFWAAQRRKRAESSQRERDGSDRQAQQLQHPDYLDLPAPLALERELAVAELLRIKDRYDRNPEDARLDLTSGSVLKETVGRWLDVDATLSRMEHAISRGELSAQAVFIQQKPHRTAKQLAGLRFESVIGHFETSYSRSQRYEDRTFNLRLAAQRLDGTVLFPGEVFDFNALVGPRDEANGYKVATVIADGELVDGIGGGTCQISGTLHGAAFFAGLTIIERYPHTRPSSYIKMGMDATVVYPTINFRFENPFDFPIAIHETVENGHVRAEVLGPSVDQVVTLIRKVDEVIPYEELERSDATLPRGHRILAQRGIPGFRLHRYRTIRRGSHTRREKWRDVYPPTPQVVRVGTGSDDARKQSSVSTPEYRADELLILTLTRSENGTPGEFAENREPGKFGERGWTRDLGMPFWED